MKVQIVISVQKFTGPISLKIKILLSIAMCFNIHLGPLVYQYIKLQKKLAHSINEFRKKYSRGSIFTCIKKINNNNMYVYGVQYCNVH